MPKKKNGPFLLIAILILIVFFTLGVKLGQRVEKTNKTINYILSLTPSPSLPTPTITPQTLGFSNYSNKYCGIKFLYPTDLKIDESSSSASFKKNTDLLTINCGTLEKIDDVNIATAEVTFKNKKIQVKKNTDDDNIYFIFNIKNPHNAKTISVKISENLYPLFENTMQFVTE